jgi:hypothetical protein
MSRLQDGLAAAAQGARRTGSAIPRLRSSSQEKKHSLSLADCPIDSCWKLLASVVDCGAAVMVSRTSDGGAISLTLYAGSERYREYASTPKEVEEVLRLFGQHSEGKTGR